jgi:hypothetical protein
MLRGFLLSGSRGISVRQKSPGIGVPRFLDVRKSPSITARPTDPLARDPDVTAPARSRWRALAMALEHGVDDFYQGVVPALVPLLVTVRHYDLARAATVLPHGRHLDPVLLSGLGVAAYHPEAARAVHATGTAEPGMGWFTVGGPGTSPS